MSAPLIPIENIYYLFCYAWNRFEEAKTIPVGGLESPDLPNLLARVLLNGVRTIMRRGLDRGYQLQQGELATVRGRIELGPTLRLRARNVRRLQCEFDELSYDLLHNRVLKASLKRLARVPTIDRGLAHELQLLARRMPDISDIRLDRSTFARVQLHRNNAYYHFLIKVAELAFECLLPDPSGGGFVFHDILRDERKMARVFEEFVRNFYSAEQRDFIVEPLTIHWDAIRLTGSSGRLPNMRADVFLRGRKRCIIIDTKYYANALQVYHGTESFHSGNLYQLFSYLKNAAATGSSFAQVEGMLLYPCGGARLEERFIIQGHEVTIATLNLSAPWRDIETQLLGLLTLRGKLNAAHTMREPAEAIVRKIDS
ncbi:5-methylcytosine-specific restriction endonuclease system specificity protein McrC [Sinorhizobium sp. A49]|uniref:5-methylcytosine-specific restriction endonuclease system specificity protein McrC n=1 Tax=Sinorhizobium sp. A49 TaxID=1945861 RepID=UPI000986568C|nr:5-methylcytosine-specific restriction endonuclease system specificity protein McrC [Sinorhizobium sp. A49]OOG70028.1 5-methylcytosine-specific restriction endonuclease system specificity protein McrC [Sinorhizobium sp. A49]